jgi:hypothetical protein
MVIPSGSYGPKNRLYARLRGRSDPKRGQRTVDGRSTDGRVPDLYSTADLPTDDQRTVGEYCGRHEKQKLVNDTLRLAARAWIPARLRHRRHGVRHRPNC